MVVLNATNEDQHVVVFGNHFQMKSKQIKVFQDRIGDFLVSERSEKGFIALPDEFEEPGFQNTPEGKEILALKTQEGVANYLRKLKQIAYNAQVSVKQDLEKSGIKADHRTWTTDGELAAMELLSKYMDKEEDKAAKKAQRVKELEQKIGKLEK